MSVRAPAAIAVAREGDAAITAERDETKFLLSCDGFSALSEVLERWMPRHPLARIAPNATSEPQRFVTTIYFDTPSLWHFRAALADVEHNVKVRAKDYYELAYPLGERVEPAHAVLRADPWLWLELKRRDGTRTTKRRVRLAKSDVSRVLADGQLSATALPHDLESASDGADASALGAYVRALDEPLRATCLVNYQRTSWQLADGSLRVTADSDLAFFSPPIDLWRSETPFTRESLATPIACEPRLIIEVKRRTPLPRWLGDALTDARAQPAPFSKFVAAARALQTLR